jgi:DNA-binding transcriptional LysR family regulator
MDKLRALQYFVAAAEEQSLSGAARRFEVSVPAVAKLITSLERELGASLFGRTVRGLKLTADGENYLDACRPLIEQLAAADESISEAAARPRGTLTVGAPSFLAQHCLFPALPRFHARYPDIQIDIRAVNRVTDVEPGATDVLVLAGWPEPTDLVHRRIGQTRFLVCAAPGYWAAHGVPRRPKDLEHHACLLFRNPENTLLDLWRCERNGQEESVAVSGWLVSNHREVLLDAAIAGEGVARMGDLTIRPHLQSGRLVPVLLDWEMKDAPPVNVLYRPNHRRTPRVRLFVDFVTGLFRELEAEREAGVGARLSAERPYWYRHRHGRASAAGRGRE